MNKNQQNKLFIIIPVLTTGQLVFTAVIMENQLSLASWVKKELMVVMKVEHFYDATLMNIHKNKTNNTELTDIAKEL